MEGRSATAHLLEPLGIASAVHGDPGGGVLDVVQYFEIAVTKLALVHV